MEQEIASLLQSRRSWKHSRGSTQGARERGLLKEAGHNREIQHKKIHGKAILVQETREAKPSIRKRRRQSQGKRQDLPQKRLRQKKGTKTGRQQSDHPIPFRTVWYHTEYVMLKHAFFSRTHYTAVLLS